MTPTSTRQTETGYLMRIAQNKSVPIPVDVFTIKGIDVEVPKHLTSEEFGIADHVGSKGDNNPTLNRLTRTRAMAEVWHRIDYLFPQIKKIKLWLFVERHHGNLQSELKAFGVTDKPYGPRFKEEWIELAAGCIYAHNQYQITAQTKYCTIATPAIECE